MLAVGRPRALLRFNLGMLAAYAAAVALAASHGLIVVSIAVSVAYLGILAGVYRFLLQRYVGISIARLIPELGPAIAGCLALAAVAEPLLHVVDPALGELPSLMVVAPAGLLAYAVALRAVSRPAWSDLRLLFARVLPPLHWPRRPRTPVPLQPPLAAGPGAEVD
jgi:hypothetical protein